MARVKTGSVSLYPGGPDPEHGNGSESPVVGAGETEPSHLIRDPVLRAAFLRAYRAYLRRRIQEAKT